MPTNSDAFNGCCPECNHTFTLADLRRMAVGDGWQRYIAARLPNGTRTVVAFDDFDPLTMEVLAPSRERPVAEQAENR